MTERWWHLAACQGQNTDLWYSYVAEHIAEAKAYCAVCPVTKECLEWGLAHETFHTSAGNEVKNSNVLGIYGGLTYGERRRLKEQRRKARLRARREAS